MVLVAGQVAMDIKRTQEQVGETAKQQKRLETIKRDSEQSKAVELAHILSRCQPTYRDVAFLLQCTFNTYLAGRSGKITKQNTCCTTPPVPSPPAEKILIY